VRVDISRTVLPNYLLLILNHPLPNFGNLGQITAACLIALRLLSTSLHAVPLGERGVTS
jgi:hypothetical protein